MQVHAVSIKVIHVEECPAALLAKIHYIADIVFRRVDMRVRKRLMRLGNLRRIRIICRVVNHLNRAVGQLQTIDNTRSGCDKVERIFPLKAFLNNIQMQQAEEAAAETKAECCGSLRLKAERCVVKLKLFQRVAQIRIFCAVCRVNATEDHRLGGAVAGKRFLCGI